jgi:hypothetical protein
LARVLVNRVWRWHFGRGIVGSPDNFGLLGDRPTHPELLDWLAVWFIDHDFSMKALHRLIVTSAVYGQAGQPRAMAAGSPDPRGIDPENRWLWHFPVLRLEAEAVRDAVLAVSGQLDSKMGGSLLHVGNREYLFDHTSKDLTKYDSRRRTVYLPVVRNNLYDVCQLLDATDATVPSGDRTTSTVATQALLMMNSPLVLDAARALAESSVSAAADPRSRVSWLIERTLGRPATDAELARAVSFVSQHPKRDGNGVAAELQPWMAFAHVLLASNEFMYLR